MTARVRPLRARRGGRFECHDDGLCCTDLHAVGPLSRRECGVFEAMQPGLVLRVDGQAFLADGRAGECPFRDAGRCALHARLGPAAKPAVCQRFPFGLVATPTGGRITTSHRCPCRTLGARTPLSLASAGEVLRVPSGRLATGIRVEGPVPVSGRREIGFDAYEQLEDELIGELLESEPRSCLAKRARRQAAPAVDRERAEALASATQSTRFGAALAWFGRACLERRERSSLDWPARPWRDAFDRAEARSPEVERPESILADFAADELWGLEWCARGPLDAALAHLCERLEIADGLIEALLRQGCRADRAAAEAVMILELAAGSEEPAEEGPTRGSRRAGSRAAGS